MPGFTIHIAIAKQYMKKHKEEIKNEEEFIRGSIAPDLNKSLDGPAEDKSRTHYGKWGHYEVITNINEFLKDSRVNMEEDYWKGYFIHLLTDHYFYNKEKFFKREYEEMKRNNDKFYNDFDCLNKGLIEKYKIEPLENIKKYMNKHDGEPKYLKEPKMIEFIEEISDMSIENKIEIIEQKGMEGLE